MMPLTFAKSGEVMNIKKVMGKSEVKRHLETLGIVTGEDVVVVSKLSGNIIINIRGTRIALDQNLAGCIIV